VLELFFIQCSLAINHLNLIGAVLQFLYYFSIPILTEIITEGKYDLEKHPWNKISEAAKDFIKKLLKVNPDERILCSNALQDPWIQVGLN
jgi:serine/threonine protein kinase